MRNDRSLTSVLEKATEKPLEKKAMETKAASKSRMGRMARAPKPASKMSSFLAIRYPKLFFWLGCCREKKRAPAVLPHSSSSRKAGCSFAPPNLCIRRVPQGRCCLGLLGNEEAFSASTCPRGISPWMGFQLGCYWVRTTKAPARRKGQAG